MNLGMVLPRQVDARERLRALIGAGLGILVTALVGRWLADPAVPTSWLIAPIGASALLVFAVPSSPMAQPWPVLAGNTVCALVGTACALWIGDPLWAAAAALSLAIGLMFALRCLHPPGGATALLAVLVHASSFRFALFPVLVNSAVLVACGVLYNRLTGRPYPHIQRSPAALDAAAPATRFSSADLDAALAHYNQVLDINRDDLEALLHHAELSAYQRHLGDLRCADIMSRDPHAVQFGTALSEAWALMRAQRIKALPVLDRSRRIVGIVTAADFLRQVGLEQPSGIGERLRAFLQPSGASHAHKPEVVGQIMTRKVQVTSMQRHAIELVPVFSQNGHKHIPVIDADQRLVGIITQSDLLRTLYKAVRPAASQFDL